MSRGKRSLWFYQFLTLHGELMRYACTNQMYRHSGMVWCLHEKPNDCICGRPPHEMDKFVLMLNSTSYIKRNLNVWTHCIQQRMGITHCKIVNLIRLFGFLCDLKHKMFVIAVPTIHNTVQLRTRWSLGFWLWGYSKICISQSLKFIFLNGNRISEIGFFKTIYIKANAISLQKKQNKFYSNPSCIRTRAIVSWQLGKFSVFFFFAFFLCEIPTILCLERKWNKYRRKPILVQTIRNFTVTFSTGLLRVHCSFQTVQFHFVGHEV